MTRELTTRRRQWIEVATTAFAVVLAGWLLPHTALMALIAVGCAVLALVFAWWRLRAKWYDEGRTPAGKRGPNLHHPRGSLLSKHLQVT